jgi:hypothetical protein
MTKGPDKWYVERYPYKHRLAMAKIYRNARAYLTPEEIDNLRKVVAEAKKKLLDK